MNNLQQALEVIRHFGKISFDVSLSDLTLTCETIDTETETLVHVALTEVGYTGYSYWYAYKVYKLSYAIKKIARETEVIYEYQKQDDSSTEAMLRAILWSWDENTLLLVYKLVNLRMKTFAGELIEKNGIEKFLSVPEQGYLKSIQVYEKVRDKVDQKILEELEQERVSEEKKVE